MASWEMGKATILKAIIVVAGVVFLGAALASVLGLFVAVLLLTVPSWAGDFDGSKPLTCAVIDIVECGPGGECQKVSPETVNVPRFVRLNLEEKQIQAIQPDGAVRITTIERIEHVDGLTRIVPAWQGFPGS
jgi:hypothetical protein